MDIAPDDSKRSEPPANAGSNKATWLKAETGASLHISTDFVTHLGARWM